MLNRPRMNRQRRDTITLAPVLYLSWLVVFLLWPKYIALRLGPFGLNLAVYSSAFMFVVSIALIFMNEALRRAVLYSVSKHWYVWISGLLFYGWIFISNLVSSFPVSSTVNSIRDFLLAGGLFLIGFAFPLSMDRIATFRFVFVSCAMVIAVIGLAEVVTGQPFLYNLGIERLAANTDVVGILASSTYRDGVFRPLSLTTHSIVMGQFLAIALLFVLPPVVRPLSAWSLCIPVLLAGVLLSTARSSAIVLVLGVATLYVALSLRSRKDVVKASLQFAFVSIVMVVSYFLFAEILAGLITGTTATEMESNLARDAMMEAGISALRERPFFGYGAGMAVLIAGLNTQRVYTIDNFYLSTAIDFGYVGLLLFILLLFSFITALVHCSVNAEQATEQKFYTTLLAVIPALAIGHYVISVADNISYIYLFAGLGLGLSSRRKIESWRGYGKKAN